MVMTTLHIADGIPGRIAEEPRHEALAVLLGELAHSRPDVYDHSRRVATLAGLVADAFPALDMPCVDVECGALVHDIGKLAIPVRMLDKPAALTPTEWQLMRVHPVVGAELLGALPVSENVACITRCHHERIDGRGYPDGLRAHEIPFGAQIVAACDSWDAMTWSRPYRRGLPFDEAAAELRVHAGAQWRHDIVRALLEVVSGSPGTDTAAPRRRTPILAVK